MANIYQIGAGLVGRTMALDLSKDHTVFLADNNLGRLESIKHEDNSIHISKVDVKKLDEVSCFIKNADIVLLAVPGFLGFQALKNIIINKKNVVDISFSSENTLSLNQLAKENNVTVIVDAGVAPGIPNYILGYHDKSIAINSFEYFVGGLPKNPKPPFRYKAPFSPIDVIEEYTRPARMMMESKIITKPALSDIEQINFGDLGTLEAFNTDGLRSILDTMPHISNMKEKTIRYPGHAKLMTRYIDEGMFNPEKIEDTLTKLFEEWRLKPKEKEFTILDIIIKSKEKKIHYRLYDEYDEKTNSSSMSRTTGFTATATVNLLLDKRYQKTGVFPPEIIGRENLCWEYINHYLVDRNVIIKTL